MKEIKGSKENFDERIKDMKRTNKKYREISNENGNDRTADLLNLSLYEAMETANKKNIN